MWAIYLDLYEFKMVQTIQVFFYICKMRHATNHLLSWQVAHLQTLALWSQLQMRDVLDCRTVLNFQVVLCATVESLLGPLLSMSATPLIVWRAKIWENVRAMETGVVLFHSVLLVSCMYSLVCMCIHKNRCWLVVKLMYSRLHITIAIQQVIKKIGMISVHGDFHTLCNDLWYS